MIKFNLLPADTFIVFNKTILHDHDRRLLSMLYQPVIGSEAINLYFTLWSYLDKNEILGEEWSHHQLMAAMRLNLDNIVEAREKIEAIGLIKTFFKKGDVNYYIYELYSPLSAHDYFKDPVLSLSLKQNIGDAQFKKTVDYFTLPKLKHSGYEDITYSFTDIFKITLDSNYEVIEGDIKRRNQNSIKLNTKIKLTEVISLIPEEIFNPRSLTNEVRDLIYRLSLIYDLDNDQMRELIINSVDERKMINQETLKKAAQNYFKFEHKGKLPTIAYNNQPDFLNKKVTSTSKKSKMIYTFETTSPHDFLSSKYVNGKVTNTDKKVLSYLLIDLKLNPGVVNVLVDYILRINDNKLNKNFAETIASQWMKSGVSSVEDALELAKKEFAKRNKVKKSYAKREKKEEKTPDWYKKDIEKKEVSAEELSSISNLINEYK